MIKPTILIGHGAFGREILQRLLETTAPRGTLVWQRAPRGSSGAGEHRLRDLALLWMPEIEAAARSPERPQQRNDLQRAGADDDFILDLYRQIRRIENRPGSGEQALCDQASEAAAELRLPETQLERRDGIAGLDLIQLAHVDGADSIVTLDNLTRSVLKRLADDNPEWRDPVQAARKLNCVQILDFDNYRRPDPQGRAIRRALRRSMESWKTQLVSKKPAIDRCYLIDGKAQDSHRDAKSRYDEITLFLELLLFANLRADDQLKALFEQGGQDQQIAATFGVRSLERSPKLLSRIAAARFAQGWLPQLLGTGSGNEPRARHLAAAMEPLLGAAEALDADRDAISDAWEAGVATLIGELDALPRREDDDWPSRAQPVLARHARTIELELNRAAQEQIRRLRESHLGADGLSAIEAAVTKDLHDDRDPVPLASVVAEIEGAVKRLEARAGLLGRPARGQRHKLAASSAAHRRFVEERNEWIAGFGGALAGLWPLAAALAALAATPFARDLIRHAHLFAAPGSPLHQDLVQAIGVVDRPLAVAPALFLILWPLLRLVIQPRITGGILRAKVFHLDSARGRLADAIRTDCDALSGLRDRAIDSVGSTLAADLLQELARIRRALERRGREIQWLRGQLVPFLTMQGLPPGAKRIAPPDDSVRMLVHDDRVEGSREPAPGNGNELERVMAANPPNPERFRSRQDAMPTPFKGWSERYCDTFLDLFAFVGRLSKPYLDRLKSDLPEDPNGAEGQLRQEALASFVKQPAFGLGFKADADKNESWEQTYCVIPKGWSGSDRPSGLAEGTQIREIGDDDGQFRVYLLKCRLNIALDALEPNP
jgi:hypothetical protein